MTARGIIVAAPRSGSGKTTVTLGLLTALRARGLAVRAAKSGPDYIDPAFHAAATGQEPLNLDSWAMAPALLDALAAGAAAAGEVLVVEASMGLFDGVGEEEGRTGAAADLAARFALPVVLVLDVSGQSQSAAAVVRGFAGHRAGVAIAGVILNKVASERHRAQAAGAIGKLGIPVVGALTRDAGLILPERHLGLVQAGEHADLEARLVALGARIAAEVDLDAVLTLARAPRLAAAQGTPVAIPPPGQRIALARDAAFTFAYGHLIAGWRAAGAEIIPFAPLADEPPPADCDACWLPGGYPELHAGALAAAARFKAGLADFARTRPVHGECGGHMVLGTTLTDAEGVTHAMAGLLSHATSFAKRKLNLGYRAATLVADGALGPAGTRLRGHEFHYATVTEPGRDAPVAELADGTGKPLGPAGGRRGLVSGTFFHAIAVERTP